MKMTDRWIPQEELNRWEEFQAKILWGGFNSEKREDQNVKGGKKEMIGVDNQTLIGYAMKKETPEWKLPLEKIQYDEFIRWCTTFDL